VSSHGFTVEERRRIIKISCEQAAGRVPILGGRREANVRETIAACELYTSTAPAPSPSCRRSTTSCSPESVYAYFREIALNSPIDVTLYNIPMFASPIDVPRSSGSRSSIASSASRTPPATSRSCVA
jgi:4-hydroxy-tetrahydrodipicolinate synthase